MVSSSTSIASIIGAPKKSPKLQTTNSDADIDDFTREASIAPRRKASQVVNYVIKDEQGVEVAGFQKMLPVRGRSNKPPLAKTTSLRKEVTSASSNASDAPEKSREEEGVTRFVGDSRRQQPEASEPSIAEQSSIKMRSSSRKGSKKFFKKGFRKFKFKSHNHGGATSASESEIASVVSGSSGDSQFADTRSIIDSPQRGLHASFVSDGGASRVSEDGDEKSEDPANETAGEESGSESEEEVPAKTPRSKASAAKPTTTRKTNVKRRYAKRVRPNLFPPAEVLRRLGTVTKRRSGPKRLRLYVDDFSSGQFQELLQHLKMNTTLFKVQIQRLDEDSHKRVRTDEDMEKLFEAICDLPALEHLCLANMDPEDIHPLTVNLECNATLQEIKMHMSTGIIPAEFMQTLATVPNLTSAEFDVGESFPAGDILKSKSIETLHIDSTPFVFEAKDVLALMQGLESNKTLQTLYLEPHLTPFTLRILAYALRMNRTLDSLHFSLRPDDKPEEAAAALTELLQVLEMNPILRVVFNMNHANCRIQPETRDRWMAVLEESNTITEFHLFDEDAEFFQKKDEVLRRNRGVEVPQSSWFCFPTIFVEDEEEADEIDEYSIGSE